MHLACFTVILTLLLWSENESPIPLGPACTILPSQPFFPSSATVLTLFITDFFLH